MITTDSSPEPHEGMNLAGARRVNEALMRRPCVILLNCRFALGQPVFCGALVEPAQLIKYLAAALSLERQICSMQLCDGNTSHAVTGLRAEEAGATVRFHYRDPLGRGQGSFLEAGRNLAGVSARMESAEENILSVSAEELERVLTAIIFFMPPGWTREHRKSYKALRQTHLFDWFNVSEISRAPAAQGLTAVRCKTQSFQEYIDLEFLLDEGDMVSGAILRVDASWAQANVLLVADLATSLILTFDTDPKIPHMMEEWAKLTLWMCETKGARPYDFGFFFTRGVIQKIAEGGREYIDLSFRCDW